MCMRAITGAVFYRPTEDDWVEDDWIEPIETAPVEDVIEQMSAIEEYVEGLEF